MKSQIDAVQKFHTVFGHPVRNEPTLILDQRAGFRADLLREEIEEYFTANATGDIVEVADALGDIAYILFGTIIEHGLQDKIVEIFNAIQESNMSKLGEDGKPIYREDGKILKGPNYFPPTEQIELIIQETQNDRNRQFLQWKSGLNLEHLTSTENYNMRDSEDQKMFNEDIENLVRVPWDTIKKHMVQVADFHDTLWYQFIDHYLIRVEPFDWTIYKILKDE